MVLMLLMTPIATAKMGANSEVNKGKYGHIGVSSNVGENRSMYGMKTGANLGKQGNVNVGENVGVHGAKMGKEMIKRFNESMKKVEERIRERIEKRLKLKLERVRRAKKKEIELKGDLGVRLNNYKRYRQLAIRMGIRSKEGFNYTKLYVVHGALAIVDYLNLVKVDIENSNLPNETKDAVIGDIDDMISNITAKIEAVNSSKTPEELRSAVKDLRDYWHSVRPKVRLYGELLIVVKLKDIIDRAEMIGMNVNASDEYFSHLDKAKKLLENATEKIVRGEDAMDLISKAREEVKEAFEMLKEIYRERLKEGLAFGNRTGEFWAEFEGNASVNGHCVVVIRGEGTVEANKDALLTYVGFNETEKNGTVLLEGEGKAVLKGNVNMTAIGEFKVYVKGKANVYIEGSGEYRVKPLPEEEMVGGEIEGEFAVSIGEGA